MGTNLIELLRESRRRVDHALRTIGTRPDDALQTRVMSETGRELAAPSATVAAALAHDLNNLLMIIVGNTQLLLREVNDRELLQEIAQAALSGRDLTQRLMMLEREPGPRALRVLSLERELEHNLPLLRRAVGASIVLELGREGEGFAVFADPVDLQQMLLNLALNARDAMPRGGRLTIVLRALHVRREEAERLAAPCGSYMVLEISDTGEGMDEATRARSLDAFFTTKPKGRGTGLGMFTVASAISACGGLLRLRSAPGRGTSVALWFRRAEQ